MLFPERVMGMEWDGGEVSVGGETILDKGLGREVDRW